MNCLHCDKFLEPKKNSRDRTFCNRECELAWHSANPDKPFNMGLSEWTILDRKKRISDYLIKRAVRGSRPAKRFLRQKWNLTVVYDRENQKEVTL